ncbi:hypothetical protein YC2023_079283 [Brassica napus]
MEEITDGVNNMNLAVDSQKKNRIQVSNTKKPLFFYVNLAKVHTFLFISGINDLFRSRRSLSDSYPSKGSIFLEISIL